MACISIVFLSSRGWSKIPGVSITQFKNEKDVQLDKYLQSLLKNKNTKNNEWNIH